MATQTSTIILQDPGMRNEGACEIHPNRPPHITAECDLVRGFTHYRRNCSVCDQHLDYYAEIGMGQHRDCATLFEDGRRVYSHAVISAWNKRGRSAEIEYLPN